MGNMEDDHALGLVAMQEIEIFGGGGVARAKIVEGKVEVVLQTT